MDNPYVQIYNYFGRDTQIEKLREEVEEFIEAVLSGNKEHMEEEMADIQVVLKDFRYGEKLDFENISSYERNKTIRVLDRIDGGYYDEVR